MLTPSPKPILTFGNHLTEIDTDPDPDLFGLGNCGVAFG
jgi:hypothetical protein